MRGIIFLAALMVAAQGAAARVGQAQGTSSPKEAAKAPAEAPTKTAAASATLECANAASAQTPGVEGPGGRLAVLRVETEDDHSKESHMCSADYELEIDTGGDSRTADILTSDDEYGRRVTLRLAGFSQDGRRVIGTVSESGPNGGTLLFDYHIDGADVRLVDLKRMLVAAVPEKCDAGFEVAGTTADGEAVVEIEGTKECGAGERWAVDSDGSMPKKISARGKVASLYAVKSGAN